MPWWIGGLGLKTALMQALLNVSVTVKNVVLKYTAPASSFTLTCPRISLCTTFLRDGDQPEVINRTHQS